MLDAGAGAGQLEGVGAEDLAASSAAMIAGTVEPPAPGSVKRVPLSVRTVWILYGTAAIGRLRKSAAMRRVAFPCSSAKANLLVRSMATNR